MPMSLTLTHYLTAPAIAGGVVVAYDSVRSQNNLGLKFKLMDGGVMAGSVLSTNLLKDIIVNNFLPFSNESVLGKIFNVAANAVIYKFAYDMFIRKANHAQTKTLHDNMENYLLGAASIFLADLLQNPIVSILV